MTKSLLITVLLFLTINSLSYSQVFNWHQDGFMWNVTQYSNIDNSGIDLTISGMETGSTTSGNPYDWVKVGRDDNAHNRQDKYVIKFSQTVDVEFEITEINRDTTGFCYNDQLILPENFILLNSSNVSFVGDTVFAPWGSNPNSAGTLQLQYQNVDSLIIYHGKGSGCNSGHIYISPLIIDNSILSIEQNQSKSLHKLIQLGPSEFLIKKLVSPPKNIFMYDINGREVDFKSQYATNLNIKLNNKATGIYFIFIELNNGITIREKLFIGTQSQH